MIIDYFTADISNNFHEIGILKDRENILALIDHCALTERYTGKSYSYRAININDLQSKHLGSQTTPLNKSSLKSIAKKIPQLDIKHPSLGIEVMPVKERSRVLLSHVFNDILPQYGFHLREKQYELALEILIGLQERKLLLCEAEVGIGKTHAYILAAIIHNRFTSKNRPIIISTSTIALQKAITEEYIPQISDILLAQRIINEPLTYVVRKGKAHYICDARLKTFKCSLENKKNDKDKEILKILNDITAPGLNERDLDGLPLSNSIKERINAGQCNNKCPHKKTCRFMKFYNTCMNNSCDFQIVNHNYFLADLQNLNNSKKRLLPAYNTVVIDESHKLLNAARQIYSVTFSCKEVESVYSDILLIITSTKLKNDQLKLIISTVCERLQKHNEIINKELTKYKSVLGLDNDEKEYTIKLTHLCKLCLELLTTDLNKIIKIFHTSDLKYCEKFAAIRKRCSRLNDRISFFILETDIICWMEKTKDHYDLHAIQTSLNKTIYSDLWSNLMPYVLTSGTMSVNGDFTLFKDQLGIAYKKPSRIFETVKESPFDYKSHSMLYIPEHMPFPNISEKSYMQAVTEHIKKLIMATHGHTLILFTSYWLLERVFFNLKNDVPYPLFQMGRGRLEVINEFRESRNGVLFASDSAGEGIDLSGDILTSLIVVKLPFPVPNPILDYERTLYDNLQDFLRETITPQMLIKLRQWFGRGIRSETDTTVFSILDCRADTKGKYREDIINALPSMPITNRLSDVKMFIKNNKNKEYFL